jgi:hypothetical protein
MEIGPISGIRAISPVGVKRPDTSSLQVFYVDGSARADHETYSSSRQESERGLEDEESESAAEEAGTGANTLSSETRADARINLFA